MKLSPEEFQHQKKQILDGIDLSRKGCIDDPIQSLVKFINDEYDFVTTSSCSGRVMLFCEVKQLQGYFSACLFFFLLIYRTIYEEKNSYFFFLFLACYALHRNEELRCCLIPFFIFRLTVQALPQKVNSDQIIMIHYRNRFVTQYITYLNIQEALSGTLSPLSTHDRLILV